MDLIVHPMAEYLMTLFYRDYAGHREYDPGDLIGWIDENKRAEIWRYNERSYNIPQKPKNIKEDIFGPELIMRRNLQKKVVKIDGRIGIGNLIDYENAALLINDSLLPLAVRHRLKDRIIATQSDDSVPKVSTSEILQMSIAGAQFPDMPIVDIKLEMYNEFTGFYVDAGWQPWSVVKSRLIEAFNIPEQSPNRRGKEQ